MPYTVPALGASRAEPAATKTIHWLALADGRYEPIDHSSLIDLGPAQLARLIDWP